MKTSPFSIKQFFIYLFVIVLCFIPCYPQINTTPEIKNKTPRTSDEFNVVIDSLLIKYKIPGAAISIVTPDSIKYLNCFGWANVELKYPVTENTHFRVGSITKTFVSLGILKLVEEGRIDLQTPVRTIAPEILIDNPWEKTDPVRIVHLLEHTAGFNDPHFNDYYLDGDPEIPLLAGLKVSNNYLRVRWKPGKWYSYSSAGYMVVGCIIEKITGEKFEDYLKKTILDPLEMSTSTFRLTPESKRLLAQGYEADYQTSEYWNSYSRPAGSLNSSAKDMGRFLQFMLNKGCIGREQIISEASIERMESSETHPTVRAGLEAGSGMGIGISYYKGFRWYSHYGSIMGFASAYTYCRDLGIGCVLLTNRWDLDFETGMTKIWDTLRNYLLKDNVVQHQFPPKHEIPSTKLEAFAGYYEFKNPPQQLSAWIDKIINYQTIKLENSTLYYKNLAWIEDWSVLIPVTNSTFRGKEEFQASKAFFKTSDNELLFINGNSAYQKTSVWKPWIHIISFSLAWIIMLSTILYAIIWIPVDLYKRITKKENRSKFLSIRIVPLTAVVVMLISFYLVGTQAFQSLTSLGQKTPINILFYISTWLFAILSFTSIILAIYSFKKPVRMIARIYALIVSVACVGMTLYLWHGDIIGLKLWAY